MIETRKGGRAFMKRDLLHLLCGERSTCLHPNHIPQEIMPHFPPSSQTQQPHSSWLRGNICAGDPCQLQHQWRRRSRRRRRRNRTVKKKKGGGGDHGYFLQKRVSFLKVCEHVRTKPQTPDTPARYNRATTFTYSQWVDVENHLHRISGCRMTASYSLFHVIPDTDRKRKKKEREAAEGCASASGNFRDTCLSPRYFWLAVPPSATRLIIFQPKSSRRRHRWMEDHEVCITRREEEEEERRRRRRECARRARWGTGTQPWFFLFRGVLMELCVQRGWKAEISESVSVLGSSDILSVLGFFFCWHLGILQFGTAAPGEGGGGGGGGVWAGSSIHKASHSAINLGERWTHPH